MFKNEDNQVDHENRFEIPIEDEGGPEKRAIMSTGNWITILICVGSAAISYGAQVKSTENIREDVQWLKQREMTPGAQAAVSRLEALMSAMDRRMTTVENALIAQRTETMSYLQNIQTMVANHMANDRDKR